MGKTFREFFREYWAWIVLPFVLVLGAVAFILWSGGGDDAVTPFTYEVF